MTPADVGLALTTPSLLDDGLLGSQGWSPCTSFDGDEDNEDEEQHHEVRVVDWPMPPLRPTSVTKPLAVKKRIVSEVWPAQGMDALGIFIEQKKLQQLPHPSHRRVNSEPFALQHAYVDDDDEEDEEPEEYPFPLMKSPPARNELSEQEKLDRLRASFSLLALDRADPHRGSYYSPEHGAPSLAEQMAYASGLGSQCDWSSPSRTGQASSDGYLKHKTSFSQESRKMASRHAAMARRPTHDSIDDVVLQPGKGAEVHRSWTVYLRNKEAKAQMQEQEQEQEADTPYRRCNTPARSRAASTIVSSSSSPILGGLLAAGSLAAVEKAQSSSASSTSSSSAASSASSRSSRDTCATSVEVHQQQQQGQSKIAGKLSPIEVEKLFEGQLDKLTPRSISCSPDLPERLRQDFGSQASSPATTTPPQLHFDDFGHLFQGYVDDEEPEQDQEDKLCQASVPQTDFSPAIPTPHIFTPGPMEALPSPTAENWTKRPLRQISGQFLAPESHAARPPLAASMKSMPDNPRFTMPKSASTASVLSRPRPFSTSTSSNALFGPNEDVVVVNVKKRGLRRACPAPPLQGPTPPTRKTSLELAGRSESRLSHNSIEVFYNESAKALLGGEKTETKPAAKGVPLSNVTLGRKPLSPNGAAQLKEASRIKAVHLQRRRPVPAIAVDGGDCVPRQAARAPVDARRPSIQFAPSPIKDKFPTFDELPARVVMEKRKMLPFKRPKKASRSEPCLAQLSGSITASSSSNNASSSSASLPTVYVARTASQRRKGLTGYEPTEPRNLALARLGFGATGPTRSSTVQALADAPRSRHGELGEEDDAGLLMLPPFPTPEGFVLVVEETVVTEEHIVVPCAP